MCKRRNENYNIKNPLSYPAYNFTNANILFGRTFMKSPDCLSLTRCKEIISYNGSATEEEKAHIEECSRCKELLNVALIDKNNASENYFFR